MPNYEKLKVRDLAAQIDAYLKRFERDIKINTNKDLARMGHPYYYAGAFASGRFIRVTYITYQGSTALTKPDAIRYLAKLDAGFVGRHFEALREKSE